MISKKLLKYSLTLELWISKKDLLSLNHGLLLFFSFWKFLFAILRYVSFLLPSESSWTAHSFPNYFVVSFLLWTPMKREKKVKFSPPREFQGGFLDTSPSVRNSLSRKFLLARSNRGGGGSNLTPPVK